MLILMSVLFIVGIYLFKIKTFLQKDKKEKRWILFLSTLAIGMGILSAMELREDFIIKYLNQTIGYITKQVIKI